MAVWYAQNSTQDINAVNLWNDHPLGTGNWLTWAALAAGDILSANGKTALNVNVDFTCLRISTAAESGGAAGGGFIASLASSARAINAAILAGTTPCLTVSSATNRLAVNGNISGGSASGAHGITFGSQACKLDVVGNVTGGSSGTVYGVHSTGGAGYPTVVGNVTGGTADRCHGIYVPSSTSDLVIVTGIVRGGEFISAAGVFGYWGILRVIGSNQNWSANYGPPFAQLRIQWASGGKTLTLDNEDAETRIFREGGARRGGGMAL